MINTLRKLQSPTRWLECGGVLYSSLSIQDLAQCLLRGSLARRAYMGGQKGDDTCPLADAQEAFTGEPA